MNKTQHDAAIRSFAAELHRLGHAMPLPADDEERAHDELLAIGLICNIISHLCPYSLRALAGLVIALRDAQDDEPDDHTAPGRH
jgi:hypothetical protein